MYVGLLTAADVMLADLHPFWILGDTTYVTNAAHSRLVCSPVIPQSSIGTSHLALSIHPVVKIKPTQPHILKIIESYL